MSRLEVRIGRGPHHGVGGLLAEWIRRYWLAGLGVLGLAALVLAVNPVSLGRVFAHANGMDLVLMLPIVLAIYVSRGLGWWITLRRLGLHVSPQRATWALFAAKPVVFLPLGDLGRVAILEVTCAAEGRDAGELTGTVAFQELMYLTLTGLVLIPGIVRIHALGAIVAVLLLLQILIFAVLFWQPAYEWALQTVERIQVLRRFDAQLHHIRGAFLQLWDVRTFLATLVFNAAGVAGSFWLFELSLHAVGATHVGFAEAGLVYALATLLGGFSFVPGSLGFYEGIITFVLAILGIAPSQAAAGALIFRGYNDVIMSLIGLGLLAPLRARTARGVSLGARLQGIADCPAIGTARELERQRAG